MRVFIERPASPALWALCNRITENVRPGSRAQNSFRKDLRTIAIEDHTDMMLRGVDRHGKPRAPLAESTLKNKKRGPGPSLIPRGRQSRFITHFTATWVDEGINGGVPFLVMGYQDILSKSGKSFVEFHMKGATKPGTNWVLPKRDTLGITPKGWAAVRARFTQFGEDIIRMGG